MICKKCGAEIPQGSDHCSTCGTSVENRTCSRCGHELGTYEKLCRGCGTPNPYYRGTNPMNSVSPASPKMPDLPKQNAGTPVQEYQPETSKKSNKTGIWIGLSCLGAVIIGVVAWLLISGDILTKKDKITQEEVVENHKETGPTRYEEDNFEGYYDEEEIVEEVIADTTPTVVTADESSSNGMFGRKYTLHGVIDKYPVKFELNISENGKVIGRYCYESTVRKYGDVPSSYFSLTGKIDDDRLLLYSRLHGKEENFERIELYLNDSYNGAELSGGLENVSTGTYFTVNLHE